MRGLLVGLALILIGFLVIAIGVPLALLMQTGERAHVVGAVWVFPLPPIFFGNISNVTSTAQMLGVPPSMLTLLVALVIVAYILFIVLIVLAIVALIRHLRSRREELVL